MPDIFLSYRRRPPEHNDGLLKAIVERLEDTFGPEKVFRDVDSILLGVDYRPKLAEGVAEASVVLAVIDSDWFEPALNGPPGTRRIDAEDDWVHIELAEALRRKIPVIPVMLWGRGMPTAAELPEPLHELAYLQGLPFAPGSAFEEAMERLLRDLVPRIRREPALLGPGALGVAFGLFSASGLSVLLAYWPLSSGAWSTQYNRLHADLPALGLTAGMPLGWGVELLRTIAMLAAALLLLGVEFRGEFRRLVGLGPVESGRRLLRDAFRVVAAGLALFGLALLLYHHTWGGPRELAGDEPMDFEEHVRPFLGFLPYSTINVVVLGVPLVATLAFAFAVDALEIHGAWSTLRQVLATARRSDDAHGGVTRARRAFDRFGRVIAGRVGRYGHAVFWLGVLILYERTIGRLTVSEMGARGLAFAYAPLVMGVTMPLAALALYLTQHRWARRALAGYKADPAPEMFGPLGEHAWGFVLMAAGAALLLAAALIA